MRRVILCIAVLAGGLVSELAAASNYREVAKAVSNDQLLQSAGVTPADARLRAQCSAAVVETDDPPEFFNCVYVQTEKSLNLFSLEDGNLLAEEQLALTSIDGIALQHTGRWSQLQIWSGNRLTAMYIHGNGWIDTAQTETVYRWLLEHGVRERAPVAWIGQ
jgi:hypothetical protein